MSRKNSNATSDLLRWSDAINLLNKLERDNKWNMVTFILISIFFGTRVGHLANYVESIIE